MDAATVLTCPKCHAPMRTYERSGIHIDQCTECRGIFLDRGELDRLLDAESSQPSVRPASTTGYRSGHDDDDDHYRGGYRDQHHGRKKRGFLSELFDD